MDEVFHALSDSNRRQIVDRLSEGPASVTELAGLLPIARPGVSRHLRVLRSAGLVRVDADAQFRIYSLDPAPLAALEEWLQVRRGLWAQRMDALHTEVSRGKRDTARSRPAESKEAS